jgi:Zn-finger nucleic acid-binding protein
MHCPDCETLLKTVSRDAWERCPGCAGEWFELPALAVQLRAGASESSAGPPGPGKAALRGRAVRRCPVCRALLRSRPWASALPALEVALCPHGHGAWLASGERGLLQEAAGRARCFLASHRSYFTFLAVSAERQFRRSTRAGRAGGVGRRSPLARLLG